MSPERPELILSLAISLDGFIADTRGGVDWLQACAPDADPKAFKEFFASVDGLIMGSVTYEQILGFGEWPYGDVPCWVMSQRALKPVSSAVRISAASPGELLDAVAEQGHKRIWLVGGAQINSAFEKQGLIDEYQLAVMPAALGQGVPLFAGLEELAFMKLISSSPDESGIITMVYRRR